MPQASLNSNVTSLGSAGKSIKILPESGLFLRPFSIHKFLSFQVTHAFSASASVAQPHYIQKDKWYHWVMASSTICTLMAFNHASSTWTSSLNFNHACIWTSIEHLELDILIPQPNSPYLFHLNNSNTILLASQAKLSKSPLTPLLFSLPTFYSPTNPTGITFKIYLDLLISLISSPTSSSKPALCTT